MSSLGLFPGGAQHGDLFGVQRVRDALSLVDEYMSEQVDRPTGTEYRARSNVTFLVTEMQVKTGKSTVVPRIVVFANQKISQKFVDKFTEMDVKVFHSGYASKSPDKIDHAESGGAKFLGDTERQTEELGGPVAGVRSAVTNVRVCSTICAQNLGRILGNTSKSATKTLYKSYGTIRGRVITQRDIQTWRTGRGYRSVSTTGAIIDGIDEVEFTGPFGGGIYLPDEAEEAE
ncbi:MULTISPECIES: hypothetical protein [unclassified Streptomyces]|uniref:hypothetical protein n=1 Tax=unclassified Streptomyces TaxID=2593676 RepID=UPI002E27C0D3|nr:hypothetical protein [Streptomyces sp. NBC_00223]